MPPVKIRLYGFVSLTRRGYLTLQATLVVLLLTLVAVLLFLKRPDLRPGDDGEPQVRALLLVRDYLPWLVAAVLVYEGVETYLVLRQFDRAEQRQRDEAELAEAAEKSATGERGQSGP